MRVKRQYLSLTHKATSTLLKPTRMATYRERALFRPTIPSPIKQYVTEYDENPDYDPSACELCDQPHPEDDSEPLVSLPEPEVELEDDDYVYFVKRKSKSFGI